MRTTLHVSMLALAVFLTVLLTSSDLRAECMTPPGDITGDGTTDVMDVQCAILTVLWELAGTGGSGPICLGVGAWNADLNCDQATTVPDIILAIEVALGLPWSTQIDADGDLCADNCTLILAGQLLGDGFVLGADDGELVLDQTLGAPRFVNTSTDGVLILTPGFPQEATP